MGAISRRKSSSGHPAHAPNEPFVARVKIRRKSGIALTQMYRVLRGCAKSPSAGRFIRTGGKQLMWPKGYSVHAQRRFAPFGAISNRG